MDQRRKRIDDLLHGDVPLVILVGHVQLRDALDFRETEEVSAGGAEFTLVDGPQWSYVLSSSALVTSGCLFWNFYCFFSAFITRVFFRKKKSISEFVNFFNIFVYFVNFCLFFFAFLPRF